MIELIRVDELEARAASRPALESLPLLGRPGYIIPGWSHLVYGIPKGGKTELLVQFADECGRDVLYFTEEPEAVWAMRAKRLTHANGICLAFALGADPAEIVALAVERPEPVVVVDTLKLFRFIDENDNAEINRRLTPLIGRCRAAGKTLIMTHHTRKSGGSHGLGATGGHAFVAVADVVLEISRDQHHPKRRRIDGLARVIEIPSMIYERTQEGKLAFVEGYGNDGLSDKVYDMLADEWQPTNELLSAAGSNRTTILRALHDLEAQGLIEAEIRPPRQGGIRWRRKEPIE